jgi:hypothetical protein
MKILLDYFFPIVANDPTPAASTAFLKQVCILVLPKDGGVTTGVVTACTSNAAVALLTNNTEAAQLFNAGMNKVYVLPVDDLDVADAMETYGSDFYTVLISSDFDDADIAQTKATGTFTVTSYANLVSGTDDTITIDGVVFTAQAGAAVLGEATFQAATSNDATAASLAAQINGHTATAAKVVASVVGAVVTLTAVNYGSASNYALAYTDNDANVGITKSGTAMTGGDGLFLGTFGGVVGVSSTDDAALATYAATSKWAAFHTTSGNKAKNMFYAFGKLLSNASDWLNQQYITMPYADDVETLGDAESLFDDKISFVLNDDEFGKRLGLFAAGGKAVVAPYIIRNLEIDMQSKALQYVSGNQPGYTLTQAALLEDEMQKVIDGTPDTPGYVQKGWLVSGTVAVTLEEDNFVASAEIDIPTPRALWRIFGSLTQS